ncbi:hypothetical protein MRX96_043172, partial [Rhipicephalus microplus]
HSCGEDSQAGRSTLKTSRRQTVEAGVSARLTKRSPRGGSLPSDPPRGGSLVLYEVSTYAHLFPVTLKC